jgi:hypothetical protein
MNTRRRTKRPLAEIVSIPPNEPEWITRKRRVPISYAANLLGISDDAFQRNFGSLIQKVSEKRLGVELGRVLDLGKV